MTSVVVVDDHELMSLSLVAGLDGLPGITTRCIDFSTAQAWSEEWNAVDIVMLDAADPDHTDDRYPGVRIAHRARLHGGSDLVVAIVTGRFGDDALRARLIGLGETVVDYCFDRDALRTTSRLAAFVRDPTTERRELPDPDPDWRERFGVTTRTELESIIDDTSEDEVLGYAAHLSRSSRSRRDMDRRMTRLNRLGLGRPGRRDRNPTVGQVRALLRCLLGHDRSPG